MEDLFSVGEKWIKTVASSRILTRSLSSRILTRSASGRPEVPARAAAAAVVAKKLVTLPLVECASPSQVPGSIYAARPLGQVAEELEDVFYENKFDPVRHLLEHTPVENVDPGYFKAKVGQKLLQLDVVTECFSKQVIEHHDEMMKGMQIVAELEKNLQLARIIVKNGRRHLSSAMSEVSKDLAVAANVRKKQDLLGIVSVLEPIHHALDIKSRLDAVVDEGDFSSALHMCSECLVLLEECPGLPAVLEVYQSIEEWLQRTISKVDALLMKVCLKFEAEKYKVVVNAYTLLDDATSLADKVQSFFAQSVVTETHDVLKHLLFEGEDVQTALVKSRLPYRDLCMQVPEAKFRGFLRKTLEVLFDLMCSYYTMMTWHKKTESAEIEFPAEDSAIHSNGKHHLGRSGSHGDLSQIFKESRHVRTGSHSGDLFATPMSPRSVHANRMLSRSGSKRRSFSETSEVYENRTFASGAFDGQFQGESGISDNLAKREEVVAVTVARALERGRKTVWEIAARRVAALLSNDAVFLTSPEQFLQSLDWVNDFILAGEAFCGTEAVALRTKLTEQCEQYFGGYHCQNLEVLRMILGKELWQPLSSLALESVNLPGLNGHGLSLHPTSVSGESPRAPQRPSSSSSGRGVSSFAEWLPRENPFAEKAQHHSAIHKVTDGDAVKINGIDKVVLGENDFTKIGEEEDNGNENLLADFIDEDSQLPGRLHDSVQHRPIAMRLNRVQGTNENKNLVLTNSSVNILRYMDRYARLTEKMQPISKNVLKGLGQLFELYFFSIFKTFGQREAFGGGRSHESYLLTPRLRATLLRISQELEEQRLKQSTFMSTQFQSSNTSTSAGLTNTAAIRSDIPPNSPFGGAEIVMTQTNFYALKERRVATESLASLVQMLKRTRLLLQAVLGQDSLVPVELSYTHTIDAVPDLRDHVYKAMVRVLLNVSGYIDRIANLKWELKDLGIEHNGYVDSLLGAFKQYSTKLGCGGLDEEIHELLLEYGVETIAETIVEGFSRVRRCNNEGRALMSLDLQVLINGLQHMALSKSSYHLQTVETYIKAFYLPQTEYLHWIRTHPEYTKPQVIGLINLVATANSWKRKTRIEMLDRVEAGDL